MLLSDREIYLLTFSGLRNELRKIGVNKKKTKKQNIRYKLQRPVKDKMLNITTECWKCQCDIFPASKISIYCSCAIFPKSKISIYQPFDQARSRMNDQKPRTLGFSCTTNIITLIIWIILKVLRNICGYFYLVLIHYFSLYFSFFFVIVNLLVFCSILLRRWYMSSLCLCVILFLQNLIFACSKLLNFHSPIDRSYDF